MSKKYPYCCRQKRLEQTIWKQYIYQRQTIRQLAEKYKKDKVWIPPSQKKITIKNMRLSNRTEFFLPKRPGKDLYLLLTDDKKESHLCDRGKRYNLTHFRMSAPYPVTHGKRRTLYAINF